MSVTAQDRAVSQYVRLYEDEALRVERYANELYWDARYHRRRMARVRRLLAARVSPGHTVFLDAGCGTGEYLDTVAALGGAAVGVDLARNYVVRAGARCPESSVAQASLNRLPFQTDGFDLVLCSEVLEHLPGALYDEALVELFRVSSGAVVLTTPNYGVLRTLGNALLANRVSMLDQSVGHVAIFPLHRLLGRVQRDGRSVVSYQTLHIMPPVVAEKLRLPRFLAPVVSGIEDVLNAVLPRSGNVSVLLCRNASQ